MKKSVLIIGGGIAGLAAARELAKRRIAVTVIEAQNRLGGRIHTVYHGNFPIELGAEFIHGESKPLLRAVADANLKTQPVSDRSRLFVNGKFENADIWEPAGKLFNRIDPTVPDESFHAFLTRQKDPDERTRSLIHHFVEGFNAADSRRISAHSLRRANQAAEQMNGSIERRIDRGYYALVDFLAAETQAGGGKILRNARALQVAWKHCQVETTVDHVGSREDLSADAVLITLPLGILKSGEVQFDPPIAEKVQMARDLEFGNVVKIILQFRDAFWGRAGFIHTLDKPMPTWWNDPRGPLLIGWAGGPHAEELLTRSHGQLERMALEIVGEIFSDRRSRLQGQLTASHYWNWASDPYTRGAYSYIPVNCLDVPQSLARPIEETLYFAGEATVADAQTGTVFGALESGLRAASQILS